MFAMFGIGGIIKSNLRVYFDSLRHNATHKDALARCLKTRYPFEPDKIREVLLHWEQSLMVKVHFNDIKALTDKDELRELIKSMYNVETHLDRFGGMHPV